MGAAHQRVPVFFLFGFPSFSFFFLVFLCGCLDLKFVQIQNLFKFRFIFFINVCISNLFRFEICSKYKIYSDSNFVQKFEICLDLNFVQNTKFVQILILFKIQNLFRFEFCSKIWNLFRFEFCSKLIFSKFQICSNLKFVHIGNFVQNPKLFKIQNCSKSKIVQIGILFEIEICSKLGFCQIQNYSVFRKEKRKKEKTGKLLNVLTGSGLWAKLYRRVLLMRANARCIGMPEHMRRGGRVDTLPG
jgi:hypothetical protein